MASRGAAAEETERLLILLRSASPPSASEIVREAAGEDILRPIAGLLHAPAADTRAGFCLAILIGVGMLRSALTFAPLCGAEQGNLKGALEQLFEAALGDVGRVRRATAKPCSCIVQGRRRVIFGPIRYILRRPQLEH